MMTGYLSPEDLNQIIFQALNRALALERAESCLLRRAWTNPAPPPPPPDRNVLYYHLQPDGPSERTEVSRSPEGFSRFFRFLPLRLEITLYGPQAEPLAWGLARRLTQDCPDSPRRILRSALLFPLPAPASPRKIPETWQESLRPRVDLTVPLRLAAVEEDTFPSSGILETPPDIRIFRD